MFTPISEKLKTLRGSCCVIVLELISKYICTATYQTYNQLNSKFSQGHLEANLWESNLFSLTPSPTSMAGVWLWAREWEWEWLLGLLSLLTPSCSVAPQPPVRHTDLPPSSMRGQQEFIRLLLPSEVNITELQLIRFWKLFFSYTWENGRVYLIASRNREGGMWLILWMSVGTFLLKTISDYQPIFLRCWK